MGELRGGYIRGDLPPEERARAIRALYEHVMGDDLPKGERDKPADEPPADEKKAER